MKRIAVKMQCTLSSPAIYDIYCGAIGLCTWLFGKGPYKQYLFNYLFIIENLHLTMFQAMISDF